MGIVQFSSYKTEQKHLPTLAKFPHLTHLRLVGAGGQSSITASTAHTEFIPELGVGFQSAICGNAYDSPGYAEQEFQMQLAVENKVARTVASKCQKLERLDFETWTTYKIARDESGQVVDIVRV